MRNTIISNRPIVRPKLPECGISLCVQNLPKLINAFRGVTQVWNNEMGHQHPEIARQLFDTDEMLIDELPRIVHRLEAIQHVWSQPSDAIDTAVKGVIATLDKADLGCSGRQLVRELVEKHYG